MATIGITTNHRTAEKREEQNKMSDHATRSNGTTSSYQYVCNKMERTVAADGLQCRAEEETEKRQINHVL
jgi:hypothetical protein